MKNEMTKYEAEHLLGLSGTYTSADITRAYRAKVKEYHPDLVAARGGNVDAAEELMMKINEANDYLRDLIGSKPSMTCDASPKANAEQIPVEHPSVPVDDPVDSDDPYGPYGGWDPNSTIGQQYYEGWKKNQEFKQWETEQKERAKRAAEERRAAFLAQQEAEVDPVEKFRWEDGPMPDEFKIKYAKIERAPYRLIYILLCVAFIFFYGYAEVAHLQIGTEPMFHYVMPFFFFTGIEEFLFGAISNAIKKARTRVLDRKLAAWRMANGFFA